MDNRTRWTTAIFTFVDDAVALQMRGAIFPRVATGANYAGSSIVPAAIGIIGSYVGVKTASSMLTGLARHGVDSRDNGLSDPTPVDSLGLTDDGCSSQRGRPGSLDLLVDRLNDVLDRLGWPRVRRVREADIVDPQPIGFHVLEYRPPTADSVRFTVAVDRQ